jgi:hypothetical protein
MQLANRKYPILNLSDEDFMSKHVKSTEKASELKYLALIEAEKDLLSRSLRGDNDTILNSNSYLSYNNYNNIRNKEKLRFMSR